ncbi:glutathione S-transferase family protein [Methylobacterium brachiatum]|jgi:glutathione S-transferase|uniref:Glutathione S-transferase n=1 Tax=Methylobacterium brachiatum TaxID=269660 RepID=A0AAJ1TJJ9_9HYPH|nr:glutathione S-transferase family protein [Methylobacterium brachiatum]MCB4800437.1 glutathione S-transferase family protein [Methylobacterium brachiatum]MDF2599046.1 putative maleylacetoacetate isomerase 1 [Methylobacterium brachiatum]MDH2312027.1 glutathione S-transferase family protein [Methylobacterium brachiatum]MDQ0541811.1 glutathione S-transferase [Methylobacterium brachiatum]CAA2158243.1 putative GST-like protein YibF [Methylobacterium brachiatum]
MIVYGTGYSPYVRKVLVSLAEKNVPYEHRPVMFHAPDADFQAASPLGKIPAIEDGGFKLADSSAILWYLERKHPTPALVPSDPQALGRAVWFDKFGDTELFAKLVVPFVERILKPNMMGKPTDDAAVAKALNDDLPPLFDCLEREISGPYLVGDAFSIADISVATGFYNFHLADAQVDAGRWPKLAAYIAETLARPSFKTAQDAKKG